MAIVRYSPYRGLTTLRDNINRMFDMAFPFEHPETGEVAQWRPTVDIYDQNGETVVRAELPGVNKEDISLDINDGVMNIKGERSSEEEVEEGSYYRKERLSGSFQRSVPLPEPVDADQVKATYKDGVLEVRVPKTEETGARRISIE